MPDQRRQPTKSPSKLTVRPANSPKQERIARTGPVVVPAERPVQVLPSAPTPSEPIAFTKVDLGPELPMPVFTSLEVWNPERIGAMAIYCSDGRWGEAFDEFCHKRLQIPRYDRLAVAGGPAWLTAAQPSALLRDVMHEQLSFLVKVHELEQIILITHYGCAAYTERLQQPPDVCLPRQLDDLREGKAVLHSWFPKLQVDCYLAMRRGTTLSFHWLNT
jgi:hypothetical protein